ncbi:MAG TPA: hypothetical protein VG520_04475 [Candidatus Dormibacteraeota bacterium]|nr:hypothetical protein [Candidatus Dormibacteraeota bacterium]
MASKRRRRPPAARRAPAEVAPGAPVAPAATPTPRSRSWSAVDAAGEQRWSGVGLLVLLGLAFVVQIPVGAVIHVTQNSNPLIIDMFFFQPQYLVVACVVVMPVARRLARQPRNLRLLESLSLGIMYALLSLILGTAFVHPASASVSTAQFIKQLKLTDGLLIAAGDVLALFGTAALYPGFSRMLSAPGRRARARMLARTAAGRRPAPPGRSPRSGGRPGR